MLDALMLRLQSGNIAALYPRSPLVRHTMYLTTLDCRANQGLVHAKLLAGLSHADVIARFRLCACIFIQLYLLSDARCSFCRVMPTAYRKHYSSFCFNIQVPAAIIDRWSEKRIRVRAFYLNPDNR